MLIKSFMQLASKPGAEVTPIRLELKSPVSASQYIRQSSLSQ